MKVASQPLNRLPWQKRLMIFRKKLSQPYVLPEEMPHGPLFWIATGLVTCAVILFCAYFITYMIGMHEIFNTNAEDLGIMDQAIWNTLHGNILHMTICNPISDTNCAGPDGVMRFAIHFEPTLFPISLIYLIWSDPRMLFVFQTIVVGLGAFPAFWLARLRLRNEIAAVLVAVIYLLYPSLQQAITFDFHAVTLTASLFLFAFYFLYTRKTIPLIVCAILIIGCKEQMPLPIFMIGLWTLIFQERWRLGLTFMAIGIIWFLVALFVIMPMSSPTGEPLLLSRFDHVSGGGDSGSTGIIGSLLTNPIGVIQDYILENARQNYLRILLLPLICLPLLAPHVLAIAAPALAINLISSNPQMHSGLFQYNADIAPTLIFASIEGIVLLRWLWKKVSEKVFSKLKIKNESWLRRSSFWIHASLAIMVLLLTLASTIRYDRQFHARMPIVPNFFWPTPTHHSKIGHEILELIPDDATIAVQSRLTPHLSQRETVYLFPYAKDQVDYILLDMVMDYYPYEDRESYTESIRETLESGDYGIVTARDNFLLLQRGIPTAQEAYCPTMPPKGLGDRLTTFLQEFCASDSPQDSPATE